MAIRIRSPYRNDSRVWLKGNLHAHTSNSDGPHTPQGVIDAYAARGYGFLMLSDHDAFTDPTRLDSKGLTLIPGNEITANGPHVLHVGARSVVAPDADRQKVLDAIGADGGFAIMCHPNWEAHFNHCPQETLEALCGYAGIEIHNGVVEWLEGAPGATDRWDRLLSAGRLVWGFANDDCHKAEDIGVAWNMVQADPAWGNASERVEGLVRALREGRFYASTGVTIDRITVSGTTLSLSTVDADRISVFSDWGYRRAVADAAHITYALPNDPPFTYLRFECAGRGGRKAWTQPFLLDRS